ncbi:MAG: hypothetical protein C0403_00125 [Desulfobacterium sp.]|nr:hypothetical protein [Desulfobacterium sp.]
MFFLFLCSSSIYFLFILPSVLTSESVEAIIEKSSKKLLNISLEIDDIQYTWPGGLQIVSFEIRGDPLHYPDPILHIDEIAFNISIPDVFPGKIDFHIFAKGITFHFFRDADGKTNIDSLMTSQNAMEKTSRVDANDKTVNAPFSLPIDLGARIELRNIVISAKDQITDKKVLIENGMFLLDSPSLHSRETNLKLFVDVALNDKKLPPVDLMLRVSNILDPETASVLPEKMDVSFSGKLPGSTVSADGTLSGKGIESVVDVDLDEIHEILLPFLPPHIANSKISGSLHMSTVLKMNSKKDLFFDSSVQLDGISLSGPMIQNRTISGFQARLSNNGNINLSIKQLNISSGKLNLLHKSELSYHGTLKLFDQPVQDSFISLDTVFIDIGELLTIGKPFLPPNFPIDFGRDDQSPVLHINGVALKGDFLSGACIGTVEKLNLAVPYIEIRNRDLKIVVNNTHFDLYQFSTDLNRFFPTHILFSSSSGIDTVFIDTKEKIDLETISIPKFQFQIKDIQKNPNSLFGYTATLSGEQRFEIQKIKMSSTGEIAGFSQTLDASCKLLPEKKAVFDIKGVSIGASDLVLKNEAIGAFQTSLDINNSDTTVVISSVSPPEIDILGMKNRIRVGDFAELNSLADIRNLARQGMETKGDLAINLGNLFQKLTKKPKQVSSLNGTVFLKWSLDGRRPEVSEITNLQQRSVTDLQKDLAFINQVQIELSLNQIHTNLVFNPESRIQIKNFSAEPLVHYIYDGKKGRGNYEGGFTLLDVDSNWIPVDHKPISAKFSFSGTHDGLQKVSMIQNFEVASLGFHESIRFALSGLDQSILQNREKNLPYFLKKTGGSFTGQVSMNDMTVVNQIQKQMTAGGAFSAGLDLLMVPGSKLGGKTWIKLNDVILENGRQFSIHDLSGDIHLEKEYLLMDNDARDKNPDNLGSSSNLSVNVMKQPDFQEEILHAPLQTGEKRQQLFQVAYPPSEMMIRFASASSEKGPLPIALNHFQTGLELEDGLPRIYNFQVDLLGGSIIASVSVQKIDQRFYLPITISFSGIQTDLFFGKTVEKKQKKDTEVSGQFYSYVPVTSNKNDFLNGLKMDILFTHIGAMALEQLLYSLDPTESNEKIVSQRKLVKKGFPRWIRLAIMDGALSLEGVVTIQGVDVDIPQVKRLNISGLSGLDPLEEGLLKISPVVEALRCMSANTIWMDQGKNNIGFIDK